MPRKAVEEKVAYDLEHDNDPEHIAKERVAQMKTPTPDIAPNAAESAPEEYEVRRAALLAKLPPKDQRPTGLVSKLALITSLIGTIQKTGRNDYHNYNYVTEGALVEAIRPLMSELGVWLQVGLAWDKAAGIIGHERVKIGDEATVNSLTILMVAFQFIDGESGEKTVVQVFPGYGDDTGDKGAYKALTGAEKYFLMKTFLVATGDDPEADKKTDQRSASRDAATKVTVTRSKGSAAAHGGRQASASSPQTRQLGETLRAMGIRTSADAIKTLEQVTGKTIKGELKDFIDGLTGEEIGAAIVGLQNLPETESQSVPDAPAAEEVIPETAPDEDALDGEYA